MTVDATDEMSPFPADHLSTDNEAIDMLREKTLQEFHGGYQAAASTCLHHVDLVLALLKEMPTDVAFDSKSVADFILEVEGERENVGKLPKQALEILKHFYRSDYLAESTTRLEEIQQGFLAAQRAMEHVTSRKTGKPTVDKVREAKINLRNAEDQYSAYEKAFAPVERWRDAAGENFNTLLPYAGYDMLNWAPIPKIILDSLRYTDASGWKTLQDLVLGTLRRLMQTSTRISTMQWNDLQKARPGLEIAYKQLRHMQISDIKSSNYKERKRAFFVMLEAFEKKNKAAGTMYMKSFLGSEQALQVQEKLGKTEMSTRTKETDVMQSIQCISYMYIKSLSVDMCRMRLLLRHLDNDKQRKISHVLASVTAAQSITKYCFEEKVSPYKPLFTIPPGMFHKVVGMLADHYQSLCDTIDLTLAGWDVHAAVPEEAEACRSLTSLKDIVLEAKEHFEIQLAYMPATGDSYQCSDAEARIFIHKHCMSGSREMEEELADKNMQALIAEEDARLTPATKGKEKVAPSSSRPAAGTALTTQKGVSGSRKNPAPDTIGQHGSAMLSSKTDMKALLASHLSTWKELEKATTVTKVKEAMDTMRKYTAPLDINSALTDTMISMGKMVETANCISDHYAMSLHQLGEGHPDSENMRDQSSMWKSKAEHLKTRVADLEKQDLQFRLEKAKAIFIEHPSERLFTFLLKHQGITRIEHRYPLAKGMVQIPCIRKDASGSDMLDKNGKVMHDLIEPYKIFVSKKKCASLHAHINPDSKECTALHFKRWDQDLLGKLYEIKQAEAGHADKVYRHKADKKLLGVVRALVTS